MARVVDLCVWDGLVRVEAEETTSWFLHAAHFRFEGFGPLPRGEEEDQGRKA